MATKQTTRSRTSSPPKRKQTIEAPAPAAAPSTAARTDGIGAVETPRTIETRPMPSHDEIAARAYELYQTRGGGDGGAESDWLRAEVELKKLN